MNGYPKPETVQRIRDMYPIDSWVMLLKMDDKHAPPIGSVGQVYHIDGIGQVHCRWENGSTLAATWPVDIIVRLEPESWKLIGEAYGAYITTVMADLRYSPDDLFDLVDAWRDESKDTIIGPNTSPAGRAAFSEFVKESWFPELVYSFSELIEEFFMKPTEFSKYVQESDYEDYLKILATSSYLIREKQPKVVEYPYIRAWGKMLGSFQSYIDDQVTRAKRVNAPQNAVYIRMNNTWATIDDVAAGDTKDILERYVEEMTWGDAE